MNLRQLAIAHAGQIRQVTWRQGTRATQGNPDASMTSHFLAIRVRPANRDIRRAEDGSLPDCWLLAEWPPHADEPTDYWLSNLPAGTPISELVRLAKIRWRVEHDYRELKTGLGLDHFEGRSFTGWHRHVTLAVLAQAFCVPPALPGPAAPGGRSPFPQSQPSTSTTPRPQPCTGMPVGVGRSPAIWVPPQIRRWWSRGGRQVGLLLLVLAYAAEQRGEVAGGELPVERPGGLVVSVREGQQGAGQLVQVGEVVWGRRPFSG